MDEVNKSVWEARNRRQILSFQIPNQKAAERVWYMRSGDKAEEAEKKFEMEVKS